MNSKRRLITCGLRNLEVIIADYATLLRDQVTLKCRSIDRIFLLISDNHFFRVTTMKIFGF
jgi:hypothetical protein